MWVKVNGDHDDTVMIPCLCSWYCSRHLRQLWTHRKCTTSTKAQMCCVAKAPPCCKVWILPNSVTNKTSSVLVQLQLRRHLLCHSLN